MVEYDDHAIGGYRDTCELCAKAVIQDRVRFQVSFPTPPNVLGASVEPACRANVEYVHEESLLAAPRRIQDHIPAGDLALERDPAQKVAYCKA